MSTVDNILSDSSNRNYPLPQKKWKYYQEWHTTVFFHWEIPLYFIEEYIPDGLEIDTFNNMAWISLVSFEVKNMRLRNLPAFPYISNFQEINLRTYVKKDGIQGIYLFSIETNKLIQVLLSKVFIGLPYQKSEIIRSGNHLQSKNDELNHQLDMVMRQNIPLKNKTILDTWLTERHALYEMINDELYRFDIHHKEWNLRGLDILIKEVFYQAGNYTANTYPDIIHYADKLEVILWGREKTP